MQPWPVVERFLQDQSPGAVGLDVGCGNGKYLPVNKSVYIVASDRYVWSVYLTFFSFICLSWSFRLYTWIDDRISLPVKHKRNVTCGMPT